MGVRVSHIIIDTEEREVPNMAHVNAYLSDVNVGKKVILKIEVMADDEGHVPDLPQLVSMRQSFVTLDVTSGLDQGLIEGTSECKAI